MIIGYLKNRTETPHALFSKSRKMWIFSGYIFPFNKGNIVPQIWFGNVFISFHNAVIQSTIQIITLCPGHFRHISKATDTKHYMLLVPTGFLRLPAFGNIIRQTSVIFSMIKEVNCIIIELTVIQKYPERKLRFSYRNSPITISIRGRLKEFA